MKKYQYKTVKIRDDAKIFDSQYDLHELERILNTLGNEGWELISNFVQTDIMGSATGAVLIFKREQQL